jgi:hypothetical protein
MNLPSRLSATVLTGLLAGCCGGVCPRPTTPHSALDKQQCIALHWLDLNRSPGLRLVMATVPDKGKRGALEDARSEVVRLPAAVLHSKPARYRDPLDVESVEERDALADYFETVVRQHVPDAVVLILPLQNVDGMSMDRRSGPAILRPEVVVPFKTMVRRGDTSPVVESELGFHLAVLLERVPGHAAQQAELDAVCP